MGADPGGGFEWVGGVGVLRDGGPGARKPPSTLRSVCENSDKLMRPRTNTVRIGWKTMFGQLDPEVCWRFKGRRWRYLRYYFHLTKQFYHMWNDVLSPH